MCSFFGAKRIGSTQDTSSGFATRSGLTQFFQRIIGTNANYEKILEKCSEQMNELPRLKLERTYSGTEKIREAPMNTGLLADFNQPVGMKGLISCVGLGVIDEMNEKQLVVHITPTTKIKRLRKLLAEYENRDVQVVICEGPWSYGVLKRVYAAISQLKLNKPTIIAPETGIVLYSGEVMKASDSQKWQTNCFDPDLIRLE